MDAGYDLYTLLDTMIDRLAWPSEAEKMAAHASVQKYRDVSLFGNMALIIQCLHEDVVGPNRVCRDCGRTVLQ